MEISCNVRVVDFKKGAKPDKYDTIPDPDELGLDGPFVFHYDYPLNTPATFVHVLTKKMSAQDILEMARSDYERIYKEEDEDVGHSTPMITGMLNRQRSSGRYRIWGHVIGDLYFESIHVDKENRNVSFGMGS